MAEYLYHTYILKDPTDTIGYDAVTEAANKADFDTNYKAQTVKITDIISGATTFDIVKTYAQFKALIDGVNILWTDVKFANEDKFYDIYLLTNEPL